jgi:hypothetical protein
VNKDDSLKFFTDLLVKIPNSVACKRQILISSEGNDYFKDRFNFYIQPYFKKGVPSIFTEVEEIYKDQSKHVIIENIVLEHMKSLDENDTFAGSDIP